MAVSFFASLEVLGGGFLFHWLFGFRPASRALASTFAVLEVEANLWDRHIHPNGPQFLNQRDVFMGNPFGRNPFGRVIAGVYEVRFGGRIPFHNIITFSDVALSSG